MHVRRDRKKLKDGRPRTYLSFAHNIWEPVSDGSKKRARPVIFARLGAEEPWTPYPQVVNDPPVRMRGHSKDKRG
ncbi:hypothetical protein CMK11_02165, partial [Candidatus Poribacteria bacterium]|nr:hypothetical protein [Candidatus Poribacteria bacterium]